MKKNVILLIIILLAGVNEGFSQQFIKGKLQDDEEKPLLFANVLLYKAKDSTLFKATITDTLGVYEFENVPQNSYYLNISFMGYKNYRSNNFEIAENQNLQIPIIQLKNEETITGVTVVAKKAFVERRIDRTIINPDALISNAGVSTLEVLEKAPGVQIDENGGIKLKGKAGVTVFIDDKPTYMSADALTSYLRGLPSNAIESIELMSNPPAKYDAAGSGGVINIKIKKNTEIGFNGGINLSYRQGVYARTSNSINLNYRINKLNIFANGSFNINNQFQDLDIERNYLQPNGTINAQFKQNSFIRTKVNTKSLRLGMDYYISKKATLGFVVNGFANDRRDVTNNNASLINASQQVDSLNKGVSNGGRKWINGGLNLNYSRKMNKGKELSANLDYIQYQADINQNLKNDVFLGNGNLKSKDELLGKLPATINIGTAKVDYTNPIKNGKIEIGAKTSFVDAKNTAEFSNKINENIIKNDVLTNYFDYKENINAAYVNLAKEYKKFSIQAGLRLENTNISGLQYGNLLQKDSSFSRNYTNLFPTLYLGYKLDTLDKNQLGFSYGRRINRPNYQDLNPFSYPLDRFTIYAGNPFLVPTFSNSLEISHTYKNKITTALEYSFTKDVITETIEFQGVLFFSRPNNIGKQNAISLSMNGSFTPTKWWTMQLYGEAIYTNFSSVIYGQRLENEGKYFVGNVVNQFSLGKGWTAELSGNFTSPAYSAQFVTLPVGQMGASLQKKILKEKGNLKLNFTDILYTFRPGGDIKALEQATANFKSLLDTRTLIVSFSYNFRKGKLLKPRQIGGSDEEKKRINAG